MVAYQLGGQRARRDDARYYDHTENSNKSATVRVCGTVKWFDGNGKGYGFVTPDIQGPDHFLHITEVRKSGLDGLREGQRIEYELGRGKAERSPPATNITIMGR